MENAPNGDEYYGIMGLTNWNYIDSKGPNSPGENTWEVLLNNDPVWIMAIVTDSGRCESLQSRVSIKMDSNCPIERTE